MTTLKYVYGLREWFVPQYVRMRNAANIDEGRVTEHDIKFLCSLDIYQKGVHILAFDDAKLVADCICYVDERTATRGSTGKININTLPEYQGKAYPRLLKTGLEYMKKKKIDAVYTWLPESSTYEKFLKRAGFRKVSSSYKMKKETTKSVACKPPTGYRIRRFRSTDIADVVRLLNTPHKSKTPDRGVTIREFESLLKLTNMDLLVVEKDKIVGVCGARIEPNRGYINVVLVADRERRKGLGHALLSKELAQLTEQDIKTATLNVDAKNTAAFRLYEKAGFEVYREDSIWRFNF